MQSSIDVSTRVVVPEHVLFRELDGESVLLDLRSERYFGLDPTGTEMWKALSAGPAVGDALHDLRELFDVDPVPLERDLCALARRLVRHGLLALAP